MEQASGSSSPRISPSKVEKAKNAIEFLSQLQVDYDPEPSTSQSTSNADCEGNIINVLFPPNPWVL